MTNLKDAPARIPTFTIAAEQTEIHVASTVPSGAVMGYAMGTSGVVPAELGLERTMLESLGFEGKLGQALLLPGRGAQPVVAVGIGEPHRLDANGLRDAAAAFARAAPKHVRLATDIAGSAEIAPAPAAQSVVEGAMLARYSYDLKREPTATRLEALTLVAPASKIGAQNDGAERGRIFAEAAMLTRDLANAPPAYLTATRMAEVAGEIARGTGLKVEVFNRNALVRMGCGGLLGVNAGSSEPPVMIKLTYTPKGNGRRSRTTPHLTLVGKGVMYDSGGISLKPSDGVHATMKQDMSGAGAILGAMSALAALDCKAEVTGYLMCTDNMPSGSATKLGDVLTIHGGTTVEVINTDAEGRLIMADALVLAAEQKPDAVVDIATLTGACLRALGPKIAGLMGNNEALMQQVQAASKVTEEPVWQLPLERSYRRELDSDIADIKNMGGANGGAIHAALFLEEFVGGLPWAHLDIAGPVLVDSDESWRPKGSSGFGARLLLELALNFAPPSR